jgi:AcrR family transcriptional regulator
MSRPPRARESVLDAFEALLIEEGERGATMDAIARAAGVSKGGLLYHFASKAALEAALIERLEVLSEADTRSIAEDPAGPVDAFIRTSIDTGGPVDRAIIAVSRLAQRGSAPAIAALRRVREQWEEALRPSARDETALELIMLVSDGLYFNNTLGTGSVPGPVPEGEALERLITLVKASTAR